MAKILKIGKVLSISVLCLLLLVGCGSSDKKTYAKLNFKNASVEQTVEIEMIHDGKNVNTQKQKGVMKFADKTTYQTFLAQVKAQGYDAVAKEYKGIEYDLSGDDATFTIQENIVLHFKDLPAAGYKKMTNGQVSVTDPYRIDLEKTVASFKQQGYEITEDK